MKMRDPKRVINGSWGEIWLDDDYVGEIVSFQAKLDFNKEEVKMAGTLATGQKVTSYSGTGSLELNKINSRMIRKMDRLVLEGKAVSCTIVGKLADPDSYGTERIVIYDVQFDDITLADWTIGEIVTSEHPFTFTTYEIIDEIE